MWRPDLATAWDSARRSVHRPRRPALSRPGDRWWTITCTILGTAALAAALLGLGAHAVTTTWQPLVIAAALAHMLMFGAPAGLVLLIVARRPSAVLALVATVLVAVIEVPQHVAATTEARGPSLTVLQANLRLGSADPRALVTVVTTHHVDVLTSEEITASERDRLVAAGLAAQLPFDFDATAPGAGGVMIWSRYPLTNEVINPGFQLGALSATVALSGRHFSLVAVHLPSPYPYSASGWARELTRLHSLMARLAARGGSVLVAGDLNATLDNGQYRALVTGGFRDGAEQSGAGYLATFPGNTWYPPLLAIDHLLVDRATASGLVTVHLPGSDHRGLIAQIRLAT